MPATFNNRIFYACQAVFICRTGHKPSGGDSTTVHSIHGVQSVGITTNFSLDQAFELGQVEIYANREEVADIELTMEKVIDGDNLIYLAAVGSAGTSSIATASNQRADVYLAIYNDGSNASNNTPLSVVNCSGMYVSSVSYTYPVDGNATESCTFVGSDKHWNADTHGTTVEDPTTAWGSAQTNIGGSDTPTSGVVRRTDILLSSPTVLPAEVKRQLSDAAAVGPTEGGYHLQNISVSADFGRDNILELGRFGPYTKYSTFPFEITSEFEVIATSGDLISVSGDHPGLVDREIVIADNAGTVIDLGNQNKLSSVSYSGGDTGGGNATLTYSYSTFNTFTVKGGAAQVGYDTTT